jgi:hypothetical protein
MKVVMQILDHTPYRTESGEIDFMGRIQGMLKFGMSWYDRIKAQDVVIGLLDKQMGNTYALLRNITLPETDITLPLVLIGPAGIFLIQVAHERGVYRAKGDEWGTIVEEHFVPARINQVVRTRQMARVLQVYLDRQGYKGMLNVEPILMSADPGMHIDSVRPSVRVVMSDALERFAISIAQTRGTMAPEAVPGIVRVIMKGRPKIEEPIEIPPPSPAPSAAQSNSVFTEESLELSRGGFASDLGFSFQEEETTEQQQSAARPAIPVARPRAAAEPASKAKPKGFLGLTRRQLIILGVILLVWACMMIAFFAYVFYTFNA